MLLKAGVDISRLEVIILSKSEDLAYLAGYIDADGTIGLHYHKKKKEYQPKLEITASRRDILEELQAIAGCEGYIATVSRPDKSKRDYSRLMYSARRAFKVCELVQPYLRLKGAQAILLIQIGDFILKHWQRKNVNRNAYYIPRYEEMKRLNEGNKSDLIR
ncbi:hypothetical protein ES703_17290 [subsurface metagenome]